MPSQSPSQPQAEAEFGLTSETAPKVDLSSIAFERHSIAQSSVNASSGNDMGGTGQREVSAPPTRSTRISDTMTQAMGEANEDKVKGKQEGEVKGEVKSEVKSEETERNNIEQVPHAGASPARGLYMVFAELNGRECYVAMRRGDTGFFQIRHKSPEGSRSVCQIRIDGIIKRRRQVTSQIPVAGTHRSKLLAQVEIHPELACSERS
jgi:hypothetical protein